MSQCKAIKKTGERCKGQAYTGKEVCRVHGALAGRPPIHGRYSKAAARLPEVLDAYERHKTDPALMETSNEIAMLRALFERFMDKYGDAAVSGKVMGQMVAHLEVITKVVERRHKMEHGEQLTLTVKNYEAFLARAIGIADGFFGDHPSYEAFLVALRDSAGE